MMKTTTVYGIPNCDTVKKARNWLTEHGIAYEFHDFKKQGVPADLLSIWNEKLGWAKLLNRKGTTWRKLDANVQASVNDASSAAAVMLEQPSVIKRPVVVWANGQMTIGFNATEWEALL